MLRILLPDAVDNHAEVARLLDRGRAVPPAVEDAARAIVAEVQRRGDDAVREYCVRFDGAAPERDHHDQREPRVRRPAGEEDTGHGGSP
jgi:histidinol dehydrogenase